MIELKHTPGPWTVLGGGGAIVTTEFASDEIIVNTGLERSESDAQLISASPDLLQACIAARLALGDECSELAAMLDDAIAKATA